MALSAPKAANYFWRVLSVNTYASFECNFSLFGQLSTCLHSTTTSQLSLNHREQFNKAVSCKLHSLVLQAQFKCHLSVSAKLNDCVLLNTRQLLPFIGTNLLTLGAFVLALELNCNTRKLAFERCRLDSTTTTTRIIKFNSNSRFPT